MLHSGAVHGKNTVDIMLKNLLDACFCALGYWLCGFALAFGNDPQWTNPFIGTAKFFLLDFENYSFMMLQFSFVAAATTVVSGAVAGTLIPLAR